MKSVADLIANKNALIKRDKRGKITAASLTAAGAAVLAAARAEAQSVDGFEDITSSVISFERIGNGQVEFELENGQRFIANEGQYIIEGNQILVSQELVTIVGGAGLNPTVIAVGVAGAALVVGALILMNSNDDDDATTTTTTTTTTTPGTTTSITSDSSGEATGTAGNDTFTVTDTSALNAITGIDGGDGTDKVSMTEILEPDTSPTLDLGSRGVTLTDVEQFSVTVDAGTTTATLNMGGEAAAVTVTNTDSSTGTIAIDELGPSTTGGTSATLTLVDIEGGQVVDVDTDAGVSKLTANIQNAGDSAADPMVLDVADSSEAITELTIGSDGSSSNFLRVTGSANLVTMKVEGSENLTIADTVGAVNMQNVATLNASGASGNLVVSVNDTVTSLTMGSGNDTVTAKTSGPDSAATWDGGSGSDTLDLATFGSNTATISGFETIIASDGTIDFTNITDVDDLQVSGNVALSNLADGAIDNQITFAESSDITISSGTETSLTLVGVVGAGGSLTVDNQAAALTELIIQQEAEGAISLDTGTATRTLYVTGEEKITSLAGAGAAALTTVDVTDATSITATSNPFAAIASYMGTSGIDDIEIAGFAAGADIRTGADEDNIVITGGTGNGATIYAGSGDDDISGAALTGGSITYFGGAGIDTFELDNDATETLDFDALTDIPTMSAADFGAVAEFAALDDTNAEQVTVFAVGVDQIDLYDLTSNDTAVDIGAFTNDAAGYDSMVTAALTRFNAGNDVVVANDNTNSYVLVDVGQNAPGSVSTIGIIELGSAILTDTEIV